MPRRDDPRGRPRAARRAAPADLRRAESTWPRALFPLFFYRERRKRERLALSIGMFTRGEVGAGIIFIALGYNLGGPALMISVLTIVFNLILTGIFVVWVEKLTRSAYELEQAGK